MVTLTILCHPCTPVEPESLDRWLHNQTDLLRSIDPGLIVRQSRLAQELPDSEIVGGWLIELEAPDDASGDREQLSDALADVLTDMRFLGMQPKLLLPLGLSDPGRALGEALSEPPPADRLILDYSGLT
jgi:hypothetical protein